MTLTSDIKKSNQIYESLLIGEKTSRSAILHSTRPESIQGSTFLLSLMESAVWLLGHEPKLQSIEIVLHPVGRFHTPQTIFEGLKRRFFNFYAFILGAVKSRLGFINKEKANIFNSKTGEKKDVDAEYISIYSQVQKGRKPVVLNTTLGTITVRSSGQPLLRSIRDVMRIYFVARRLWRNCHKNGVFEPQRFLKLDYCGVVLGDLVSATALRLYPQAGGSVKNCLGLWPTLLNAVAISDYITNNVPNDCHNSYVYCPEPIYLHAIYLRWLYKQGASELARYHYAKDFVLISQQQNMYSPMVIQTNELTKASDEDTLRAKNYMQERIDQPNRLWYMVVGANNTDNQMWDIDDNLIDDMKNGLYVVLFLHSFDDGQFCFGVDGFDDLYHWTIFTINQLIANPNVTKVFVKLHPNTTFIDYIGDGVAFKKLYNLYAENRKLTWLRKDCSLKAIAKMDKVVGITHHGSVSEELTYLGVPVIASSFGPWGNAFAFVNIWRNPEEYKEMLKNLSRKNWEAPSLEMIDDLLGYVVEYRLSATSIGHRRSWMKFAQWADGEVPAIGQEIFYDYCKRLSKLRYEDTLNFLEWLIVAHKLANPNRLEK